MGFWCPEDSASNLETVGNALVAQGSILAIIPANTDSFVSDGNIFTYEIETETVWNQSLTILVFQLIHYLALITYPKELN